MKSREFKYLRRQTIQRHHNACPVMSIGRSGLEVKGGIKCGGCGFSFPKEQMLRCTNDNDVEWLCDECNDGTWYCTCCGQFCAGISSFEESGICDNCRDQIEADQWEDEEEYDSWESEGLD